MTESWCAHPMVRLGRQSTTLMETSPVMQEMFASGWRQMTLIHSVQTLHHTLVDVFVFPYNLPPSLCLKYEFMFLCLIIPNPDHPCPCLNMMLKSLVKGFKQLWIGVEAYDYYKK
jgi:hypothetical protein